MRTFVPMRYERVRRLYDAGYAERTDRFAASQAWQAESRELLEAAGLRDGQAILDYGCNTGRLLEIVGRAGRGCRYVGVDVNESAIETCRRLHGPAGEFLHYDGRRLPLPDQSMDLVVLNHSIGHVEDAAATLREVCRVLRRGGTVAIATPNRSFKRAMIIRNLVNGYSPDRTVLRYYTSRSLRRLLRGACFSDIRLWRGGQSGLSVAGRPVGRFRSRLFATARRPAAGFIPPSA